MTDQHDDHLDALWSADRRHRPLPDGARRRIEQRMLAAYAEGLATATREVEDDSPLVVLDLDRTDAPPPRRTGAGRRVLAAAAAVLVLALAVTIGLRDDTDTEDVNVAGPEVTEIDPDALRSVRTWCENHLPALRTALDRADDEAGRRVALDELATAGEGLADLVLELRERRISRRLNEVAAIPGQAAVLRDGPAPVDASSLDDLVDRLQDELSVVSGDGSACDISE